MSSKKQSQHLVKFKEVFECALLPEHVKDIQKLQTDISAIFVAMTSFCGEGFAISVKLNEKKAGYSASAMQMISGKPNAGIMIFGNGPTPEGALAALVIKLDFLGTENNWLESQEKQADSLYY